MGLPIVKLVADDTTDLQVMASNLCIAFTCGMFHPSVMVLVCLKKNPLRAVYLQSYDLVAETN